MAMEFGMESLVGLKIACLFDLEDLVKYLPLLFEPISLLEATSGLESSLPELWTGDCVLSSLPDECRSLPTLARCELIDRVEPLLETLSTPIPCLFSLWVLRKYLLHSSFWQISQ